jgi:hypothetical protein
MSALDEQKTCEQFSCFLGTANKYVNNKKPRQAISLSGFVYVYLVGTLKRNIVTQVIK